MPQGCTEILTLELEKYGEMRILHVEDIEPDDLCFKTISRNTIWGMSLMKGELGILEFG